ncbi:MAG: hybrid sensor histidine kinase/response regulator [Burkholderiaceae bacterium]
MATADALLSEPGTVLFVDDEPLACKWFARSFGGEFKVVTAGGVNEALGILEANAESIAVLVTDYRMPERNGLELLQAVQRDYRHVVRLLASAYAEKDVAIAAVNEGQVFRILEKPLDEEVTRATLREAVAAWRQRSRERALHENRAAAMRETLGFLAHELNTPLTTVRGYMAALKDRLHPDGAEANMGVGTVLMSERRPGEVAAALDAAERSALHCQSLVSTFVQSARDAYPGSQPQSVTASALLKALLDEYPFDAGERAAVASRVESDFELPGRRDLLYLVLCTLTKNALQAMRGQAGAKLTVCAGTGEAGGRLHPWIRFEDNGPGIPAEVLARLTREPVTTKGAGGTGMGLVFCRRVVQSIGGSIAIASQPGRGTAVTLHFQSVPSPGRTT